MHPRVRRCGIIEPGSAPLRSGPCFFALLFPPFFDGVGFISYRLPVGVHLYRQFFALLRKFIVFSRFLESLSIFYPNVNPGRIEPAIFSPVEDT